LLTASQNAVPRDGLSIKPPEIISSKG